MLWLEFFLFADNGGNYRYVFWLEEPFASG